MRKKGLVVRISCVAGIALTENGGIHANIGNDTIAKKMLKR